MARGELLKIECRVCELLAQGLSNKQIAYELHSTVASTQVYIQRIRAKVNPKHSRVQLAMWWRENETKVRPEPSIIPVVLETPYAANAQHSVAFHVAYARAAMRDSLLRGEAPFAPHILYTQDGILDDSHAVERQLGIAAGFAWRSAARLTVVYEDLGVSAGMREGIRHAEQMGQKIEFRFLGQGWH